MPIEPYPPDENRLQWAPSAKGLWKVILNDKPLPKRYQEEAISADKPPGTPAGSASSTASGPASSSASGSNSSPASDTVSPEDAEANGLCT